jgi:hypothetical protein
MRRYDQFPGKPYSVTSILRLCWPQPSLDEWKLREAARHGTPAPDTSAAERGTRTHTYAYAKALEMQGVSLDSGLQGDSLRAFWPSDCRFYDAVDRFFEDHIADVTLAEVPVWDSIDGYAGTLDNESLLLTSSDLGEGFVRIDWKTAGSDKPDWYPDHALQMAAYNDCDHALIGGEIVLLKPVSTLIVVRLLSDGTYRTRTVNVPAARDAWNFCLKTFDSYREREAVWT